MGGGGGGIGVCKIMRGRWINVPQVNITKGVVPFLHAVLCIVCRAAVCAFIETAAAHRHAHAHTHTHTYTHTPTHTHAHTHTHTHTHARTHTHTHAHTHTHTHKHTHTHTHAHTRTHKHTHMHTHIAPHLVQVAMDHPIQRLYHFAVEIWPGPADSVFSQTKVLAVTFYA